MTSSVVMKAIEPQWLLDFMRRGEKTLLPTGLWGGVSQHFQCSKEVSKGLIKGSLNHNCSCLWTKDSWTGRKNSRFENILRRCNSWTSLGFQRLMPTEGQWELHTTVKETQHAQITTEHWIPQKVYDINRALPVK